MLNQLDASPSSQVALLPTVVSPTELVCLLRGRLQQHVRDANRFLQKIRHKLTLRRLQQRFAEALSILIIC